jgi:hypothetical protein
MISLRVSHVVIAQNNLSMSNVDIENILDIECTESYAPAAPLHLFALLPKSTSSSCALMSGSSMRSN